jgi:hypothetical protein
LGGAALVTTIGTELAERFHITERLGSGGIATVVAAHDRQLDCEVALKILHPHLAESPLVRERFRREVALCRTLEHPGIVRTWELYEADGHVFFSMERCDGPDLKEWVRQQGLPSTEERRELIRQIGAALASAHDAGVVHRDIKPHNVIRQRDGTCRVLDFGLARVETMVGLTASSVVLGTPEYLAPEALGSVAVDARADLYSLGVLWFELATGHLPFTGSTFEVLRRAGAEDGPAPENIPPAEAAIVQRLLRRDPAERYASAQEVLAALDADRQPAPPLPQSLCPHCGHAQDVGLDVCLDCGAPAGALTGDALLVLTRGDGDPERLSAALARFGARPSTSVDPLLALGRRPAVLLVGIDGGLARSLQRQLLEAGFTTDVRREADDLMYLLHGDGVPGAVFAAGLFGGWATLCAIGWAAGGLMGLCLALAAGPAVALPLSRGSLRLLTPAFELARTDVEPSGLAGPLATFLEATTSPSLRRLGAQLVQRAWRLDRAVDRAKTDDATADRLRRLASQAALRGLDALATLQPVEEWLERSDPRQLFEDLASAQAQGVATEAAEGALLRLGELQRERERRLQRVLRLTTQLEAARAELAGAALEPDSLSLVEGALRDDVAHAKAATKELNALLGQS